ncbi:FCD domain-containing protein [Mycobacterium sp. 94-17]|uniref:FCD domain-containing protein n=1 Tax=Mycobacterium sp. 94-17 TaxID=2986147 RepID=UPI002D1F5D8F|nr:FCD domain-containing protein [Mycobacterium sp. 94-17]MEB4209703.1 FCD domain-containing protein [Mycobacterium sp. 94-17]
MIVGGMHVKQGCHRRVVVAISGPHRIGFAGLAVDSPHDRLRLLTGGSRPCPPGTRSSLDEHQELLDALGDKDVERARTIAERHVLDAGRSLADWLERRSVTSDEPPPEPAERAT